MQNDTFTDILMNMRRKAQVRGRPLTEQELSGAIAGQAEDVSTRLARNRQLDISQQNTDIAQERNVIERERMDKMEHAAKEAERRDRLTSGVVGAALGWGSLGVLGPVGAVAGFALGWLSGDCIIITACTDRNSYEVGVARAYRDRYMSIEELAGYYQIADIVAPVLRRIPILKALTKKVLIDSLVDYGEWFMHLKEDMKRPKISKFITLAFLIVCEYAGIRRIGNGEPVLHSTSK